MPQFGKKIQNLILLYFSEGDNTDDVDDDDDDDDDSDDDDDYDSLPDMRFPIFTSNTYSWDVPAIYANDCKR